MVVDDNDDGCWSICCSLFLFVTIADDDEIDVFDPTFVVADGVADDAVLLSFHLQTHSRSNSSMLVRPLSVARSLSVVRIIST